VPISPKHSRLSRPLTVAALVLASSLGLRGSGAQYRAHLSDDLVAHQARHTSVRARVIVHGTADEVDAMAARIISLSCDGSTTQQSCQPTARN